MSEITKTSIVVGLAGLLFAAVWFSRSSDQDEAPDMRGKELFAEFDDPTKVASLEIVEYDESTATARPFKVAQVDGSWSIPSHEDYPADAKEHLANATTDLLGLKVLDIASENQGDHSLYGVIDPDPKTISTGATGVGTRVVMRDAKDKELLLMVIGNEVPDQPGLRYVRHIGQDSVYIVKVDSSKLSTKFEDWIEKDLLKLNPINIKQIDIHDYSIDIVAYQGRRVREQLIRSRLLLEYDESAKPSWTMAEKRFSEPDKPILVELGDDEELDTDKINDLKNALDDLKIVDVRRKPEGLSGDLKTTGSIQPDQESFQSLNDKGYYMVPLGEKYTPLSDNGESRIALKDGVQYVLRFGRIATSSSTATEEKNEDVEKEDESTSSTVNRYLFVMVEFNPDMLEKPELMPLPENIETTDDKKEDESTDQEKVEEKEEGETPDQEKVEEKKEGETPDQEKVEEKEEGGTPDQEKVEEKEEGETPDQEKVEEKEEGDKTDQEKAVEEERKRIEKENTRKQEAYDEEIEQGKKAVAELNDRFAKWYYIISDEVYQKIHLGHDDLVKLKGADDAAQSGTGMPPGEMPPGGMPPGGFHQGDIPDYDRFQKETFTPDDFQWLKETAPQDKSTVGPAME